MATKKATDRPAGLEGQVLMAIPTPQIKLATIDDCRREMARVYRDARTARADTADASRLVYMLTSIAKMFEIGGRQNPELTPFEQLQPFAIAKLSGEELTALNDLLKKCL
jgi:hypothetical protein